MTSDKSKRKYFRLCDLIIMAVVILSVALSIVLLLPSGDNTQLKAVIAVDGKVYTEIPLDEVSKPYELTVHGKLDVLISVSSDGVGFVSSHCPDKLCVNTGILTRGGQSAVCLPARVSLKLVSDSGTDTPDAIVG